MIFSLYYYFVNAFGIYNPKSNVIRWQTLGNYQQLSAIPIPQPQKNITLSKKEDDIKITVWELRDSNPRPSACKADALNQLS